jgi:hypothetical protein
MTKEVLEAENGEDHTFFPSTPPRLTRMSMQQHGQEQVLVSQNMAGPSSSDLVAFDIFHCMLFLHTPTSSFDCRSSDLSSLILKYR